MEERGLWLSLFFLGKDASGGQGLDASIQWGGAWLARACKMLKARRGKLIVVCLSNSETGINLGCHFDAA
jgi:hypothetical protein